MKIQPHKLEGVQLPSKAKPKAPAAAAAAVAAEDQTDPLQLKIGRNEITKQALKNEPAVRPEVVERAKKLAADPNYPSPDILAKIAERFISYAKNSK